jgi:hypothetical protein
MKIKQLVLIPLMGFAVTSYAVTALFQAGDIFKGEIHPINKDSGLASYYAKGQSGQIEFTCHLDGNNPKARLTAGKNFLNEFNPIPVPGITLSKETNKLRFIWTLKGNADNGNIKVDYKEGENVTVQCMGMAVIPR